MKKVITLLMTLMFAISATAQDEGVKREVHTVAIMTFSEWNGGAAGLGEQVSNILAANMSNNPKMKIFERTDLKELLKEKMSNLDGTVNPSQAARICELSGATLIISGYVVREKDKTSLATTIFDAKGRMVTGMLVEGAEPLKSLAQKLSEQIIKGIIDGDSVGVKKGRA